MESRPGARFPNRGEMQHKIWNRSFDRFAYDLVVDALGTVAVGCDSEGVDDDFEKDGTVMPPVKSDDLRLPVYDLASLSFSRTHCRSKTPSRTRRVLATRLTASIS